MKRFNFALLPVWLGVAVALSPKSTLSVNETDVRVEKRDCQLLELPKRLQSLDLVLDSIALTTKLQDFQPPAPAEVILSVRLGERPAAHFMDTLAVGSFSPELLAQVVDALRPVPKGFPRAFRLHLESGPTPSVRIEPSVLCAPLTDEGASVTQLRFSVGISSSSSPPPRGQQVTPSLRVDETGKVYEVKLGRGTGNPEVDRALQEELLRQRFRPALLDGRPVEVWLTGRRVELAG